MTTTRTVRGVIVLAAGIMSLSSACGHAPGDTTGEDAADAPTDGTVDDVPRDAAETYDLAPLPPACGDGRLDPGEECDDRNRMNGDGCDWLCREGDGTYEYPEPDPAVPPIAPAGPPVVVVPPDEVSRFDHMGGRLVWGPGVYGLAYASDQPHLRLRFRTLDRWGHPAGEPWEEAVPWSVPAFALVAIGDRFALLSERSEGTQILIRWFDAAGRESTPAIRMSAPPGGLLLFRDAAWSSNRFGISWSVAFEGHSLLQLAREDGSAPASPVRLSFGASFNARRLLPTPSGFVATDGIAVVFLDLDASPLAWTGITRPGSAMYSHPKHVVVTDEAVLVVGRGPGPDVGSMIWMTGADHDGRLIFPPRPIIEDDGGGESSPLAAAAGPAGVAIAVLLGTNRVLVFNTDGWGGLRSPPADVLPADSVATVNTVLEMAADDRGYALLVSVQNEEAMSLLFLRYEPVY